MEMMNLGVDLCLCRRLRLSARNFRSRCLTAARGMLVDVHALCVTLVVVVSLVGSFLVLVLVPRVFLGGFAGLALSALVFFAQRLGFELVPVAVNVGESVVGLLVPTAGCDHLHWASLTL